MSSLQKKKGPKGTQYYVVYPYTEYSKDGTPNRKSKWVLAGKTKANALEFKRQFDKEHQGNRNSYDKKESSNFADFVVDEFLPWCKVHKAKSTYDMNEHNMYLFIEYFGNIPLEDINVRSIERWVIKRSKDVSGRTVNIGLTVLSQCLKKAVDWDMLNRNVVKRVSRLKEKRGRLRFFSEDEIKLMLDESNPYLKRFIMVGLLTGMRHGEILSIKLKNIDLRNNLIHLVCDSDFQTKTRRDRSIPIPPMLRDALPDYIESWVEQADMSTSIRTKEQKRFLFCDRVGNKLKSFSKSYNRLMDRLGIRCEETNIHTLRHTYSSHMVMRGVDLLTLATILGHSSTRMTEKYAHLNPKHRQDAVKLLGFN
jgi:integrase